VTEVNLVKIVQNELIDLVQESGKRYFIEQKPDVREIIDWCTYRMIFKLASSSDYKRELVEVYESRENDN
jgi:hypothetical protein